MTTTRGSAANTTPPSFPAVDQQARDDIAALRREFDGFSQNRPRTTEEINTLIEAFVASRIFGDNLGRPLLADFKPDDFTNLPAFGRFGPATGNRMAGGETGYYIAFRDTQGSAADPVMILAWTDGPTAKFYRGWKMGANLVWQKFLTEIEADSITEAMLSPAVRAKLNRVLRTTQVITYIYAHVNSGQPAPPIPVATDFNAAFVPPNGFTLEKDSASTTPWRTDRPVISIGDIHRLTIEIKGTGFDDTSPVLVIAAVPIKDDDKDEHAPGGLTAEQVDAKITAALQGRTDLTAPQQEAVRQIATASIAASGHQTAAQVQTIVDAAIATVSDAIVGISITGMGASTEITYTTRGGGTTTSLAIPAVPVPEANMLGWALTVIAGATAGTFTYAWKAFVGITQATLDAVKTELQGQISLLADAVASLGRVMSWNAILQEFTKGTLTDGGAAYWRLNHEGERTYNHPLEWGFAKWGTGNFVTGGNVNDLREAANHRWGLIVPSVAQSRHFADPNANGNPWPGKKTFYTGGGVYATGCDAAAVINNGFLAMCMAIKRKPVALPSNDNLHHRVLWMQNGGVDGQLIGYHNNRLVARVANASGATTARSYTRWLGLIAVPSNEALPPLVNNNKVFFQLPDNIANGQKVRITVHAHVEGSELAPAVKEFTIANVAANQNFWLANLCV